MKFRARRTLDTSQVSDRRGRRRRARGHRRRPRGRVRRRRHRGSDPRARPPARERVGRRRGRVERQRVRRRRRAVDELPDRRRRQPAHRLPRHRVVNSVQEYWSGAVQGYTAGADRALRRPGVDRVRRGRLVGRAVLLPGRRAGVPRPRLLRRAAHALRRAGRPVRRGVRGRPRVRPPRAGPARDRRPGGERPRGPDVGVGAAGAAGRLLRRCVGGARGRHRAHRADHRGRHRRRPRRRRGRRRRPHPARRHRPASTASRGRTVRRSNANSGSRPGTTRATRTSATHSPRERSES